jgi:hypothetical protein
LSGSEKLKTEENKTPSQKGKKNATNRKDTARLATDEARPLITTWPNRLGLATYGVL